MKAISHASVLYLTLIQRDVQNILNSKCFKFEIPHPKCEMFEAKILRFKFKMICFEFEISIQTLAKGFQALEQHFVLNILSLKTSIIKTALEHFW